MLTSTTGSRELTPFTIHTATRARTGSRELTRLTQAHTGSCKLTQLTQAHTAHVSSHGLTKTQPLPKACRWDGAGAQCRLTPQPETPLPVLRQISRARALLWGPGDPRTTQRPTRKGHTPVSGWGQGPDTQPHTQRPSDPWAHPRTHVTGRAHVEPARERVSTCPCSHGLTPPRMHSPTHTQPRQLRPQPVP